MIKFKAHSSSDMNTQKQLILSSLSNLTVHSWLVWDLIVHPHLIFELVSLKKTVEENRFVWNNRIYLWAITKLGINLCIFTKYAEWTCAVQLVNVELFNVELSKVELLNIERYRIFAVHIFGTRRIKLCTFAKYPNETVVITLSWRINYYKLYVFTVCVRRNCAYSRLICGKNVQFKYLIEFAVKILTLLDSS